MSFSKIAIIGPGLLGASAALAWHRHQPDTAITAWSRKAETRALAQTQAWCREAPDTLAEAVHEANFVLLCTPVATIVPLFLELAPLLSPQALVSDVGSVKGQIVADPRLSQSPHASQFIGSHPMAGSEKTGMAHARANLFNDRACFITPSPQHSEEQISILATFWQTLGMRVSRVSAEEHDHIVAKVSHLPHAIAASLCHSFEEPQKAWLAFAAGGFADTSRIAAGSPEIWTDIFQLNKNAVLHELAQMQQQLQLLAEHIEQNNESAIYQYLRRSKELRDSLPS